MAMIPVTPSCDWMTLVLARGLLADRSHTTVFGDAR
jgi:hypothetical protein